VAVVGNGRSVHTVVRSRAIADRGHDVRLVTVGPVLDGGGFEVKTRPLPHHPFEAARAARGFLADLEAFRPDLLHVHYAGGRLGRLALLSAVRPLVVTVMGGDVLEDQHPGGRMSRADRRTTRRLLDEAATILVKSDALRPAVAAFGDFGAKVRTVRWGVDPAVFRPDPEAARALRDRLGLAPTDRVVLSPRILQPLYNVHLIVEAMPQVLATVPDAVLLVTEYQADGDYRRRLEEIARAAGCASRVRFVGRIAHADMPALYTLAEAVVSVPASDGLPQSLFEALACEAPTIVGALEAYREIVQDGETGGMSDFTASAIAAAVERILGDAALRARMGSAGRRRVSAVASLPREAERVEGFYREALTAPRRRRGLSSRLGDAVALVIRGTAS
jgi:glycosyltransferase involved in cell wall biosynthesis